MTSVSAGQADAAVSNNFYGARHAREYGLVETPLTFGQVSLFFASSSEVPLPTVFERLDHHLLQWKSEGDSPYFRAVERALAVPTAYVVSPVMVLALAAVVLLTLLLAAFALLLRWRVSSRSRQLVRSNARLQRMLDSAPVMLYSLRGTDFRPNWVSVNIERILGFRPADVMQPGWWQSRIHPDDRHAASKGLERLHGEHHLVREYRIHDAAGKIRYMRDECQYRPPGTGWPKAEWVGTLTDLTADYEQQEALDRLAHYDARTGLPNRALLQQRIDETLESARRERTPRFLLLLNLDRFKAVNESLGLAAGDQVLQSVARRLTGLVGPGDTVARVGADEFCVMTGGPFAQAQIEQYGERLLGLFEGSVRVAGREIVLTASIGIAHYPRDGLQRDELISAAELALEAAKRGGGNCLRAFEPGLSSRMRRRLFLETELRQALAKDQLLLHYQPQYDLESGRLVGLEALVRWVHPERGMISPGEFVPLAEETGLIEQIDRWVLGEAVRQLATWDAEGLVVPRVSVNLSARELHVPDLVSFIQQVLTSNGVAPHRLELEITETMLMAHPGQALQTLRQLAALGVRLSMDDFGTGYSNLAYLRRLPLHQIKVDQSFVQDIGRSRHNESIVEAIIALSRALELELVAEGVETREQYDFLRKAGCALGQGFLFARPLAASELARLLRHQLGDEH